MIIRSLDASSNKVVLTEEQMRCVINAGNKSLIIEGGDKTGKSLTLIKMLNKLLEDKRSELSDDIAYFDSVSEFERYISEIYDAVSASNDNSKRKFVDGEERIQIAEKALKRHKDKFGRHRFHSIDAKVWLEEFDWTRGMNIDRDEIDDYLMLDHSGRDKVIKMNAADRVIAFQIFDIYGELLEDSNRIDALAQSLFLFRHMDLIPDYMKKSHILMDDGQQLTKVQASILGKISKRTVVVSINRSVADINWDPKDIRNDVEIRRLTIKQDTPKKEFIENGPKENLKSISVVDKKQPGEKRKYTIDTSKARSGSLFRKLKEKEGSRIRLTDGLTQGDEDLPKLDKDTFNKLIEEQTLSSFIEAFKMLRKCKITRKMDDRIKVLIERIEVLGDSIDKYQDVYQPDIYSFFDCYIPEILRVSEKYLDHVDAGIKWKILHENEMEILSALDELVIAVNDKIDEIYRFASIELEAQARAVESIMNQNGYVKSEYKM